MALISCKECGKEISNKAEKCPNCGVPLKSKRLGGLSPLVVVVGVIALFFILFVIIGNELKNNTKTDGPPPPVRQLKLDIVKGWEWVDEGDWTYIRGSVKNVGDIPISYFEVRAEYKNEKGEVLDSNYTNSGELLRAGAAKKFEIMHRDDPQFKKVSISIGRISKAD